MSASLPLERPDWAIDPARAADVAARFIAATLESSGQDGLVVGLSGGIDSAVATGLAVRAVGRERVHAIRMPYRTSSRASLDDAAAVADALGLEPGTRDITAAVDAFLAEVPDADAVRRGNVMARVRMITLFDASQARRALVLGTGNRTEWLLGYTTLHGDEACGLNPVAQLYKTEIRLLARYLELPRVVLEKAPSADLWEGQSDEDELGFTYADADRLLHHMVDEGLMPRQLEALGFAPDVIERVSARMRSQAFKRAAPPVCDLGRPDPDAA
ncbi:NAD+ synthase [bacterium]|nr:NAD+ synthase [bacterium]